MAELNSQSWQSDDLLPEEDVLSNGQVDSEEEPIGMFGSGSDDEFSVQTPEQKLTSQLIDSPDHISETYLNSGNGSSDSSSKDGSEAMSSSSSSSSDAESGTYGLATKKHMTRHANAGEVLQPKVIEPEVDIFDIKENLHALEQEDESLKKRDMLYEKLIERVANYEADLKDAKIKLQASQEEVAKLKYENLTLVEELGGTIEKLRISEDKMKEMEIKFRSEFQENQQQMQGKLDVSNHSVNLLQAELASEKKLGSELQEMIAKTEDDLSDYSREVEELKHALHDAQNDFSKDKSQFQSVITSLHEQKDALQTRLEEAEMRNNVLEEQIQQSETEKMENANKHVAREASLMEAIRQLEMVVSERNEFVDSLNKSLDAISAKYDLLMAEKDEMSANLGTLRAEVNCRDANIQQLEERISRLTAEQKELVAESQKTQKLAEELTLKAAEQEKELEKQTLSICDRADEKREAIRQLCYALEYYRTEYHELRLAILKHKRPAVLVT